MVLHFIIPREVQGWGPGIQPSLNPMLITFSNLPWRVTSSDHYYLGKHQQVEGCDQVITVEWILPGMHGHFGTASGHQEATLISDSAVAKHREAWVHCPR